MHRHNLIPNSTTRSLEYPRPKTTVDLLKDVSEVLSLDGYASDGLLLIDPDMGENLLVLEDYSNTPVG